MMGTMTSRERVLASINHKTPDRVPVDLGGTTVTGISAIAYHNLKQYLGLEEIGHTRVYDLIQQLALVEDVIIEKFQLDVLDVGLVTLNDTDWYDIILKGIPIQFPKYFHPRQKEDGIYEMLHKDGTILAKMTKGAFYFEPSYFPYSNGYSEAFEDLLDAMNHMAGLYFAPPPFDNMQQKGFWKLLKTKAQDLRLTTNKPLTVNIGGNLFEFGINLRRIDNFLKDLIRNRNQVEKLLDKLLDFALATLSFICQYLGKVIDIIRIGDDLGSNMGPFMNPRLYREIFKPRLAEICNYIKKHSNMKIFFHSCGSIKPIIPDLIDAGIDIINPVQTNVKNMDPKGLKQDFGDVLTFWGGGADTKNVLNRKSPSEVEQHVSEMLDIFAPGGGFIFSAIHNILPDVPPENIVAMFHAVQKYNEQS